MRVALLLRLAVVGDVDLAADDRLDALLAGLAVELDRAGERAVVGERDGRHLELGRARCERRDAARPVEDRVLGVDVQVDEVGLGHGRVESSSASRLVRAQRAGPTPRRTDGPRRSGPAGRPARRAWGRISPPRARPAGSFHLAVVQTRGAEDVSVRAELLDHLDLAPGCRRAPSSSASGRSPTTTCERPSSGAAELYAAGRPSVTDAVRAASPRRGSSPGSR